MGKSTVLKAAAIALMSPIIGSTGYRPYSLVRQETEGVATGHTDIGASVRLYAQDFLDSPHVEPYSTWLEVRVSRRHTTETCEPSIKPEDPHWEAMYADSSPAFFFVGYGASRTVESPEKVDRGLRRRSRHLRYDRVAGLFEEQATLIPPDFWLPEFQILNPERYKEVATLLGKLLPEGTSFRVREGREECRFYHRGLEVQFDALSDGYRAYIGWISDLLYHMCLCCPNGEKLIDHRGIVMIDEVDLHLHPEWQRVVLPTISQAFPRLQFICTTHSPIVAGTVESANLHLVLPDGDKASVLVRPEVEVHGLTAAQILQSSHFGLVTTRAPDFYEELQEVSRAVSRGEPGAAVRFMEMISLGAGASGTDDRQATR